MKRCGDCGETKPLTDFHFKNMQTGKLHSRCKACQRAYAREHYQANKGVYIERAVARKGAFRARLLTYKQAHGCRDCGETDPTRLHFHHLDPSTKVGSVMYMCDYHPDRVRAELEKCVVLCQPCHVQTHRQMKNGSEVPYASV